MPHSVTELSASLRTTLLLAALEPSIARSRLEEALTLVGVPASAVDDAVHQGLLHAAGERVDVVDRRLERLIVRDSSDHECRRAHVALASVRAAQGDGEAHATFERLTFALADGGSGNGVRS